MNTRHLVDPELAGALDSVPTFDLSAAALPIIRGGMDAMARERVAEPADDLVMEEVFAPGRDGAPAVRLVVVSPRQSGTGLRPGFIHFHGGGFVMGSADMSIFYVRQVARATGATVVSVDYRLAPETSFPGPQEDGYAALAWLHGEASARGIDPARIAIGGDSAGGGLAASLALLARDRGEHPVCFQLLNYPMLDDRTAGTADPHPMAGEFIWNDKANHFGWSAMLGCDPGGPDVPPLAAPARATDLAGLPPAFIGVGALDLFLEEDMQYAQRLMRANVPVELHVYPGAYHGFDLMVENAGVSRRYRRDLIEALTRALAER